MRFGLNIKLSGEALFRGARHTDQMCYGMFKINGRIKVQNAGKEIVSGLCFPFVYDPAQKEVRISEMKDAFFYGNISDLIKTHHTDFLKLLNLEQYIDERWLYSPVPYVVGNHSFPAGYFKIPASVFNFSGNKKTLIEWLFAKAKRQTAKIEELMAAECKYTKRVEWKSFPINFEQWVCAKEHTDADIFVFRLAFRSEDKETTVTLPDTTIISVPMGGLPPWARGWMADR